MPAVGIKPPNDNQNCTGGNTYSLTHLIDRLQVEKVMDTHMWSVLVLYCYKLLNFVQLSLWCRLCNEQCLCWLHCVTREVTDKENSTTWLNYLLPWQQFSSLASVIVRTKTNLASISISEMSTC